MSFLRMQSLDEKLKDTCFDTIITIEVHSSEGKK